MIQSAKLIEITGEDSEEFDDLLGQEDTLNYSEKPETIEFKDLKIYVKSKREVNDTLTVKSRLGNTFVFQNVTRKYEIRVVNEQIHNGEPRYAILQDAKSHKKRLTDKGYQVEIFDRVTKTTVKD